jgi:hypothetical protein
MSSLDIVIPNRKVDYESIDQDILVHSLRGDGHGLREETEDEDEHEVCDRKVIDWCALFTKTPPRGRELVLTPALDANASDGDDVGRE